MNKFFSQKSWWRDISLIFLSSGSLILAFPKTDIWILAWGGLVPLMLALEGKKPFQAFGTAFLGGIIFFAGTLFWIMHVTLVGASLIILYCSLYYGFFGLGYSYFRNQKALFKLFLLPSIWVALEYLRAHLLTGFDWASLGHSQYKNLAGIQIADLTGVFGVSFIIVMVSFCLKEILQAQMMPKASNNKRHLVSLITVTGVLFLFVLGYGFLRLKQLYNLSTIKITIVQTNIPLELKWDEYNWPAIMNKIMLLTQQAAATNPDLIIWPETSFPGFLTEDNELYRTLKDFVAQIKIPLLFGTVVEEGGHYYNSAVLLSKEGKFVSRYDKVHLVIFGEYIPFREIFPFLSDIVPIDDFTAGKMYTSFSSISESKEFDSTGHPFSVLICFEDTIATLTREFVKNGAQLLINMTNDAWFQDTKAPFMHLQSALFRTVENRRCLVRAANTGVSCFIDSDGRLFSVFSSSKKATYVPGYLTETVHFSKETTFYTKFGDIFTYFCIGLILFGIFKNQFMAQRKKV